MKKTVNHEKYGEIVYTESNFSGATTLTINGKEVQKTGRKIFLLTVGDNPPIDVRLTGNFLVGATLEIENEKIVLTEKIKWYEIVLSVLPFMLIMIWGNSVALCRILPVVGGAIGGAIGGVFSFINLFVIKLISRVPLKILTTLAITFICFLICLLIGHFIVEVVL